MRSARDQLERLEVAREAVLVQDQAKMFQSVQALTDTFHNRVMGVPVPSAEDDMIHIGDITNTTQSPSAINRPGLSPLAAVGIGLLGAMIPAAGIAGYLLNTAKPVIQQVEKVIQQPGKNYDVDVDMEVIPPAK